MNRELLTTRMIDTSSFADIINAIESLGKTPYFNDTAKTIANFNVPKGRIAIVVSPRALKSYDPCHPERIRCILCNDEKVDLLIIVKNRDLDVKTFIRYWDQRKSIKELIAEKQSKCDVCCANLINRRKISFQICCVCSYIMCKRCFDKVAVTSSSHKCPQCRQWLLDGEDYGLPYKELDFTLPDDYETLPLPKKLYAVLSKLDGRCLILPRVDEAFVMTDELQFCKASYTNRYLNNDINDIIESIMEIYNVVKQIDPSTEVRFYTLRTTYKIDKQHDLPIDEIAAFKITTNDIRQYAPDSWIDVFDEVLGPQHQHQAIRHKVTYLSPHEYTLPKSFQALSIELAKIEHAKVVSIVNRFRNNKQPCVAINFDVNKDNVITSAHEDFVKARICDAYERLPTETYVTCRILKYDDIDHADYITYKCSHEREAFEKLDSKESRKLFNENIDNLKRSKYIQVFL
jgi:hypothetical protein